MIDFDFSPVLVAEIRRILAHGNRVELQIIRGKIAVIEISRKLRFPLD